MTRIHLRAGILLGIAPALHAAELSNGDFKLTLADDFPAVVSYTFRGNSINLPEPGQPVVRINGRDHQPQVKFVQTSADRAFYQIFLPGTGVSFRMDALLSREALKLTIGDLREAGPVAVRTIAIPGLCLLAGGATDEVALGNFPAASYASEKPEDHDILGKVSEITLNEKNRDAEGQRGVSYAFASNGKTAAGLYTNVMEENLRMIVKLDDASKSLTAAPGQWTYREIPTEICPAPQVMLVVAADNNGDGKVTWQDAAIAYRRNVPQPYGGEKTKDYPIAHIAMNFGSQATNPFLRVLDNAKKIWLYTDGLGQRIQQKGFAGEGHDSSHPDYAGNVGLKMGGREDLNFMMRRGHDFNVQSGVHINAHEYHKEAKWFSPEIADLNAVGWSWLDESYLTDYRYDSAYGTLYQRLDAMRQELPFLDFAYLDVYYGRGWPGWRMHAKTNDLGILQFTEFPGVMERAVVWNHVANDWTQAIGGKGDRSEIARFIWFSQKDTFKHEPLLRGTNCDGFMGWHAERNMLQTVKSAFTVNLPTKYLQHFDLIRQEKEAAWFGGGVRAGSDGAVSRLYGRDGQLINSCRYEKPNTRPVDNLCFIPWDPQTEAKIYHWNDKGGDSTWDLPKSWSGLTRAHLYRLTDLGRVFEREVPVDGGKVTLAGVSPGVPYVLYREIAPALPEMEWGEGGLVRDPGFDSHAFEAWNADGAAEFVNHAEYGQTELVVASPKPATIRQTVDKLVPGKTYAASVWASIDGEREISFAVESAPAAAPPFTDKLAWKTSASVKTLGGDRLPRLFDGNPDTLWHSVEAKDEATRQPHSVTVSFGKDMTLEGFIQTCRKDKGNGAIKGYLAATSADGKSWKTAAKGEFDYGDGTTATVRFAKPVKARFFKLTATSTLTGKPFTSIAELDFLMPQSAAPAEAAPLAVSNNVTRTRFPNYTDQSSKYMRNWHRLKVVFTAPVDGRADLVQRAGEGDAKVSFDDVRLVATGVSKAPAGKVLLFEDFENCDEAWGPFMYGWQGPMNTHLSEANPPYTNDTIGGKYSLKSRLEDSPNLLYRTVPASLKLKPDTTYKVSFDYLSDKAECFAFFAGPDSATEIKPAAANVLKDGSWKVKRFTTTFRTDDTPDWFIGITKLAKENKGTVVIDNLLITE